MARRSPTNARYAKYTGPEGKTRKSAAAAKPTKAASGSVKSSSSKSSGSKSSSSKSSGSKSSSGTSAISMRSPDTPEFKALRRQWWIALAVGLALTGVSMAIQAYVKAPWGRIAQPLTLGMAYAAIGYAFYIDWKKMRPMRQEALRLQRSGKAPKAVKPAKATVSKTAAEKTAKKSNSDTTNAGSDAD